MDVPGPDALVIMMLVTVLAWAAAMAMWLAQRRTARAVRAKAIILAVTSILVLEVFVLLVMWIVSDLVK